MRRSPRPTRRTALTLALCVALSVARASAAPPQPAAPRTTAVSDEEPSQLLTEDGFDPSKLRCNRDSRFSSVLREDARAGTREILATLGARLPAQSAEERRLMEKRVEGVVFWRLVRAVLVEGNNNNLGVFPLRGHSFRDAAGRKHRVLVFRSGITPSPEATDSCFRSLLEHAGVRHVVNIFDGEIPIADLAAAEARAAAAAGATYHTASDAADGYGPWRDLLRAHYDDPAARRKATIGVARLIREQILAPDGAPPKGNVYFHCGGGMHRSGMIAGVMERCVNHEPMDVVERHYLFHVGYRDPSHPGGREDGNLRFIREFDCALLDAR